MESQTPPKRQQSGLRITGLTIELGGRVVIDDLSIDVMQGEFITVLGNSGCGKTTLLRYIAGFVPARKGDVSIGGRRVTDMPPHRRNVGLLYQNYALFPHMSVFENVAFGLRARKMGEGEIQAQVAAALRSVRMSDYDRYRPAQLSGGMQQRIALARALVIKPDVLLLDEPVSALDANLRAAVRTEIKLMHEVLPELTVIYVTHDREDALVLADRVLLMQEGRVAQMGTPGELYDRPRNRFVANYLGATNFLPNALVSEVLPSLDNAERKQPGVFCIRPESLRLDDKGPARFRGRVIRCEWRGSAVLLAVAANGQEPVVIETPRRGHVPAVGDIVTLSFGREDCFFVQD